MKRVLPVALSDSATMAVSYEMSIPNQYSFKTKHNE
jgi:hypothetical protein